MRGMTNRRTAVESLHSAARGGDSGSLQRLIAAIDPAAAEKVAAVLFQRGRTAGISNNGGASAARRVRCGTS